MRSGTFGEPFSQTSSIARLAEKPWWRMSAGMQAQSPARCLTTAFGRPVVPSLMFQTISSDSVTNHSQRSLPCSTGRMYSSDVGQNRLSLTTEQTDGFHVTSDRERYANKLNADTSFSKPGSG